MKQNDYYVIIVKYHYLDDFLIENHLDDLLIDKLYLLIVRKNNKDWGNFYSQRIHTNVRIFKRLTTRFADKLYTSQIKYTKPWTSFRNRLILPSVHCNSLEDIINRYTRVMKEDNDANVKIICSYETK